MFLSSNSLFHCKHSEILLPSLSAGKIELLEYYGETLESGKARISGMNLKGYIAQQTIRCCEENAMNLFLKVVDDIYN
jgi:hypothetical protein